MMGTPRSGAPQAATGPGLTLRPEDLRQIIVNGDAEVLVKTAEAMGKALAYQLTSSQIRNIFGTVRQIEMNWPLGAENDEDRRKATRAARQLVLLKPKLAYQTSRVGGLRHLATVLSQSIDLVEGKRDRFQHFVDFLEAIVAYHVAAGGQAASERRG